MKCTVFLTAMFVLMFCALFAGCTGPTEAKIKPIETTVLTTTTDNNISINCHGSTDTTISGNPSLRTKC